MRIAIGCDHRGIDLKKSIMAAVAAQGHTCQDMGAYDPSPVDYPDVARKVAEGVARKDFDRGILICGTGIGMSISANKVNGIRAALCHNVFTAQRSRIHNDANVLCLGAEVVTTDAAREMVSEFLKTEFEGGRHAKRLDKIRAIEC